jgi:hypothetical protein
MNEISSNREANRIFSAWRIHGWGSANLLRHSFLRFAASAPAPRDAGIFRSLQIVGKHYRLVGGEGGFEPPGPFRIRGGIQSDFGALFGSNKSTRAGEILFAWNSALSWIYRFSSFARLTRKIL